MGDETSPKPSLAEALALWGRIGVLSFGGPAGQIALMHRLLVDERRWISEQRFLHALNFCMLLPGPEAMQLATYIGWRLHGTIGGLAAGLLFVLPGAAIVLGLTIGYAYYGNVPLVEAAFVGVKAAVLVIVIEALLPRREARAARTLRLRHRRGGFRRDFLLCRAVSAHHRRGRSDRLSARARRAARRGRAAREP